MSQTGARALGSSGKTYKEILGFYYPLTRLISNYGSGSYELIGSYMNQTGVTCQESGSVNIRNQANGSIIRTLGKDVTVTVLAEDPAAGFGWFRIRDPQGNTDGWIRWDFVEFGGNGGSEPPPSGGIVGKTGTVSVNSAGLNVRSSPNGSLLPYKLYNGHRITVLQEQAAGGYNWFRVKDEEGRTDGWVRSDFIVLDSGSGSGYSSWQEKYGDNTFVNSTTYSGNVYRFQVDLNKWLGSNGYSTITEDGKWGSNSSNATRTFQANNGLTADGLAGPSTKQKLFSLYGQ
jgi:peptidoglycan hydrolase-like protein with peptidoglycan-binding domain